MPDITNEIIVGVAIVAIPGIITFLYSLFVNYVSRKKRLIYGLYNELLSNHEMLDSCINFDKEVTRENIPRLDTQYYEEDFSKSNCET